MDDLTFIASYSERATRYIHLALPVVDGWDITRPACRAAGIPDYMAADLWMRAAITGACHVVFDPRTCDVVDSFDRLGNRV